jgi:hypothetical protein
VALPPPVVDVIPVHGHLPIGPFGSSVDGRRARRRLSHEGSQEGGLPASSCGWSAAGSTTVGPAPAVERLLPELDAHGEYIAAELRRRTRALVVSGWLSIKERDE